MGNTKVKKKKKRGKIRYKSIFLLFVFLGIVTYSIYKICNIKVKNIFVSGNSYLTDQQIIDYSRLDDYPKIVSLNTKEIKNNIKENIYIKDVKIKYNKFRQEINIEVQENIPVIYYLYEDKTILSDYSEINDKFNLPMLINQTPDELLHKLVDKLYTLDKDVFGRISEIKYSPVKVDEELFLLTMNDGYYVYINFNSFSKLDNYIEIIKSFDNKKGIIHLDSGDYLDIYDESKKDEKKEEIPSTSNKQSNNNLNNNNQNTNQQNNDENDIDEDLEKVEKEKDSNTNKSNQN